ncbi:hypothetical protein D3C84_804150 [compost metagenome]
MFEHKRCIGFAAGRQAQAETRLGGFANHPDLTPGLWAIAELEWSQPCCDERLQAGIQLQQRQVCALHTAPQPTLEREGLPLV